MVSWTARTGWNELDPIPEVVRGVQTNFLENIPAAPFYPSFLYQTTGVEGMCGVASGDLIDDLVNELLWEVGHGGGRLVGSD